MTDQPPVVFELREEEYGAILDWRLKFVSEAWGYATAYDTAITLGGYATETGSQYICRVSAVSFSAMSAFDPLRTFANPLSLESVCH